jgi:dihydropteroate synthase
VTPSWQLRDRKLELGAPVCAGIVNVTDDSMFEGARSGTPERAVDDGAALAEAGFEMLDVGAVAARSGPPVSADREAAALVPAIEGLVERTRLPVSADTFSAEVAVAALGAGAVAVNDISGGHDPALLELCAATGAGLVLMQIDGRPREEREPPRHRDVIEHLKRWFSARLDAALARGVDPDQIVLDPGLDFDLGVGDGLEVLRRLDELLELGRPLYVSLSRKDLLGAALGGSWEERAAAEGREWATAGAAALAVRNGASILRLHDPSALQSVQIAGAIVGRPVATL